MPQNKQAGNSNVLNGLRCPNKDCKSLGPYRIMAISLFECHDDGAEQYGDIEWDDSSYCLCVMCGHDGVVRDFKLEWQGK